MPLYEYKCESCGEIFEAIQRFSDEPLKVHATCGGGPVTRLLCAPALQFKGSGWYITDYARSGGGNGSSKNGKSEKSEGSAPAASGSKSEAASNSTKS